MKPGARRGRVWIRRLSIAGLALVALAAILYATRRTTLAPQLVRAARGVLRSRYQCELEIEAVGGSWWGDLELEGVRLERTAGDFPVRLLEGGTLRASYSLFDLLRGRAEGLHSLELEVDSLALDLTGTGAAEPETGGGEDTWLELPLPAAEARVGALDVVLPGERRLHADALRLDLDPAGGVERFELGADEVRYDDPLTGPVLGGLAARGERRGGTLTLAELRLGEDVVTGSGFLDLTRVRRGEVAWHAEVVVAEGSLGLTGKVVGSHLEGKLEAADIDLGHLVRLAPESPLERGVLQAGVELSLDVAAPWEATASATARVTAPTIRGRTYDDLVVEASLAGGTLEIPRLRLQGPGEELVVQDASAPLRELAGGELPPSAKGRIELTTELAAAAAWDAIRPEGAPIEVERLRLEARLERGELTVQGGDVETSVGRVDLLGGTIDAAPVRGRLAEARLDLQVSAAVPDLGFLGVWIGTRPWAGAASATGRVSGTVDALTVDFETSGEGLVLHGVPVGALHGVGTVDADGLVVRRLDVRRDPWSATVAGIWTFSEGTIDALTVNARGPEVTLTAGGDLTLPRDDRGLEVELDSLGIEHAGQRMQLVEGASVAVGPEGVAAQPFELESELGRATIAAESAAGGPSRVVLTLEDFDPMPLLTGLVPEGWSFAGLDLTASMDLGGELAASAELEIPHLVLGETLPSASFVCDVDVTGDTVRLHRLALVQEGLFVLHANGSMPRPGGDDWLRPGPLSLELEADLPDLAQLDRLTGTPVARAGTGRIQASLGGEWTALTGTAAVSASGLVVAAAGEAGAEPIEVTAEVELGEVLRVVAARIEGSDRNTELSVSGTFGLAPDVPARLAGWPDDVLDAPLDLSARAKLVDPSALVARLGSLERLRGGLEGDLEVHGTLRRPLFAGRVDARDAEVRFAGNLPALREVDADLELQGRALHVRRLSGELGGAPVEVTGTLSFDAAGPIELHLAGTDLLLTRSRGLLARANTDLDITGTALKPRVSGQVVLTSGRFTRPVDLIGSTTGGGGRLSGHPLDFALSHTPPLSDLQLDVSITAAEPFPIRNNVMRGSIRPDVRLIGEGDAPVLEGSVFLGPTTLTLPAGTLKLDSGIVIFRREKPLAPELALSGSAKMKGYDLSVQVTGDLEQPEVVVTATPPLPPEDALLLLLTGRLPEQLDAAQAGQTVVVYLTKDFLTRWFTGDSEGDDESLLDRFEIEFGTDVTRSGQSTYLVRYRVEGEPQGTGQATYLTTERDVYDRTNFGYRIVLRTR